MTVKNIDRDHGQFKRIVRGKIKQGLRKYISNGELIGRKGKNLVSIPIDQIDIPDFRYEDKNTGGIGQGGGDIGTILGPGNSSGGGAGAGNLPGEHILEVEIELEELAKILGEELELPRIKPKGKKNITSDYVRYTGIRETGPESLRHFKHTYKEALKRQLIEGSYDPLKPKVIPFREDKRYRSPRLITKPESSAVIFYMMDVSGSMGDEQKEIVRIENFWISTWLNSQYKGLEEVFIVHHAIANKVDRDTFYRTRESGGTVISSAYRLCHELINTQYLPNDFNIYCFHFSDGDNWGEDENTCKKVLVDDGLLDKVELFCYGQVKSAYGGGNFKNFVEKLAKERDNVIFSETNSKEEIYDSIKEFLGKGK